MKNVAILVLCSLLIVSSAWATDDPAARNTYCTTGEEVLQIPDVVPTFHPRSSELDEYLGDTCIVGMTYYDFQHNGTVSRMIAMFDDPENGLTANIVWMSTLTESEVVRHVKFNRAWYNGGFVVEETGGYTIDAGDRAGYICLAENNDANLVIPAFHSRTLPADPWVNTIAGELDILPGVFNEFDLSDEYPTENQFIWPHVAMGPNNIVHVIVTEQREGNTDEQYQLYYRAQYEPATNSFTNLNPNDGEPIVMTTHGMNISSDIAVSSDGQRVAFAQTFSRDYLIWDMGPDEAGQFNNDVYLFVSEDGGENWNDPLNVTNHLTPNPEMLPDTVRANQDTLRAYTDLNVYIDHDDVIHLAFTVNGYWRYHSAGDGRGVVMSKIYHWDEVNNQMTQAADGYFFNVYNPGDWQSIASRPSMAQDDDGILYMAFQQYGEEGDTLDYSTSERPNSEIFITASPAHQDYYGLLWATPVNITNSRWTQSGGGPAGECRSEKDVSLSLENPGDYLNLTYIVDLHGGAAVREQSEWTNNPVVWHRVPIEDLILSFSSWLRNYPLHLDSSRCWLDPHDYEWEPFGFHRLSDADEHSELPSGFELDGNHPNPFNPTTSISFTLPHVGAVRLVVYDVLGREVAVLLNRQMREGRHTVSFDGSDLASGVYFYRLEYGSHMQMRKMALIK